jgi:hypothetical protein
MPINTAGQTFTATVSHDNPQDYMQVTTYNATTIVATDHTRITCGFKPRKIKVTNLTDRVTLEWYQGMAANRWLRTADDGTITLDTTANALVVSDRSFDVLQNATLGLILASKQVVFEAWG